MRAGLKVNIATPAYRSQYAGEYVRSLYALLGSAAARGVRFSFSDIDYADVVTARNYLLSNFFFNRTDCSHVLFLDSDMGWQSELIHQMLALGEDLVGVIAPRRHIDLKRLHALSALPFEKAYAASLDFAGAPAAGAPARGGFREVEACGAGILLVSRRCVATMVERCPEILDLKRYRKMPFAGRFERFLTPFDKIRLEDRELSEDVSFCHRWRRQCGGRIYASVASPVRHVAELVLEGRYEDR